MDSKEVLEGNLLKYLLVLLFRREKNISTAFLSPNACILT